MEQHRLDFSEKLRIKMGSAATTRDWCLRLEEIPMPSPDTTNNELKVKFRRGDWNQWTVTVIETWNQKLSPASDSTVFEKRKRLIKRKAWKRLLDRHTLRAFRRQIKFYRKLLKNLGYPQYSSEHIIPRCETQSNPEENSKDLKVEGIQISLVAQENLPPCPICGEHKCRIPSSSDDGEYEYDEDDVLVVTVDEEKDALPLPNP